MRIIFLFLLLGIVSSSCNTKLRQQVKAHNYFNKYPIELAALCGTKFPPEEKYIPGKPIVIPGDTVEVRDTVTITVDCPDGTKVNADCPPNKTRTVRDTIKITDTLQVANTALITDLNYKIATLEGQKVVLAETNSQLKKNIKNKNWQLGGLITLIVLGVIFWLFNALRVKR